MELKKKYPHIASTSYWEVRYDPDVYAESQYCLYYSGKCIYDTGCRKCPLMIVDGEVI